MSRIKNLREEALAMHKEYQGKIEVRVKAPVRDNDDLTLAYSPGVAEPCMEIHKDPAMLDVYTNHSNFVCVVSNGTAVLGHGGIGAAAARRFAAEGARIVLADKDEANGHEVANAIVKEGGEAAFCLCDVGNEADVQAALDTAARTYGKLDIVVNNAGWQLNKTLLETTAEEFNAVLNTNLTSMFLFTKGAANMFIAQKTGGAIVNVCSTFAVVGSPGYVAYHASKGGVASFTRAAAISLMPHNIRVNAVGPGTTETPGLHDGARDTGDEAKGMASFLALQPLKRFGKPEEIASVIAFLARDAASFVTGALWMADGGHPIG